MKASMFAVAVILLAGVAAAAAYLLPRDPVLVTPSPAAAIETPVVQPSSAMEDRVSALEAALTDEREARRVLEDELVALYTEIDRLKSGGNAAAAGGVAASVDPLPVPPRTSRFRERDSFEARTQSLVDQGLTPERAAYILQRESELRFEQMQAFYEARNSDNPEARLADVHNPDDALRAEIGEAEYEKYLKANNRSTSVTVEGVLTSSPAAAAGLQPGDEILRYDGERVYNSRDLIERAMDGDGQVVVEVMRDGNPIEVVIPRGPLGIEIGRRRG